MPTLRRKAAAAAQAAAPAPPADDEIVVAQSSNASAPIEDEFSESAKKTLDHLSDAAGSAMASSSSAIASRLAQVEEPHRRESVRVPVVLQYPLVVILSLSISSLAYSSLTDMSKGELAEVSKSLDTWGEVATLASWRMFELALGWFGNYDALDLAALNLLSHGPTLYLLSAFYRVSPTTALLALAIDVLSTFVPFQLLRPLSGAHSGAKAVPNREIVTDLPILSYTVGLSAGIYSVLLVSALRYYLPRVMVLYFEGLPDLSPAYSASYQTLVPVSILFGLAASIFIFTPFAAAGRSDSDAKLREFNPVEASFSETVVYNLWGYKTKTKIAMQRTAAVVAVTGINTFLQCAMTVAGVETTGAAAYAGVWSLASLFTGIGLALVGRED